MYLTRTALLAAITVSLLACGGGGGGGNPVGSNPPGGTPPSQPVANATIGTTATTFNPDQVALVKGGTVVFNIGAVAHNVIFAKVTGAPGDIPVTSNTQVSRTFSTEGSFAFDCTLHAGMSGTVTVK